MPNRIFFFSFFLLFLLSFALLSKGMVNQPVSVQGRPIMSLNALDQTTQMHMEILTRLSEIHRQTAAEVATLDQQRTALVKEIEQLTARREAGTATLDKPQEQAGAETERLKSSSQVIASEIAERDPEPPSGDQSPLQGPSIAMQSEPASTLRPRVLLNYSPNRERGRAVAAGIVRQLGQNGYAVVDMRGVNVQLSSPTIRYFFPEDRPATTMASEIVAASLGEEGLAPPRIRVQNFTWSPRKPVRGTLEVWIPVE
jgi:TolA-binding protein